MTDRELLELAAKAAGYDISHPWNAERLAMSNPEIGLCIPDVSTCWNPLTDDGDALRLALDLGISIGDPHQYTDRAFACTKGRLPSKECWVKIVDGDYYAATRRAIVLAAG